MAEVPVAVPAEALEIPKPFPVELNEKEQIEDVLCAARLKMAATLTNCFNRSRPLKYELGQPIEINRRGQMSAGTYKEVKFKSGEPIDPVKVDTIKAKINLPAGIRLRDKEQFMLFANNMLAAQDFYERSNEAGALSAQLDLQNAIANPEFFKLTAGADPENQLKSALAMFDSRLIYNNGNLFMECYRKSNEKRDGNGIISGTTDRGVAYRVIEKAYHETPTLH